MTSPRRPTVFLTGASSGIGLATATLLTQSGYEVWGTTRFPDKLSPDCPFHPLSLRLEDPASIETAWNEALRQSQGIDIVIQNAGEGIFGSLEEVSLNEARRQWLVLVEGPLLILQLASAHFRPKRQGLIIGVSSLAAEMPMPFSSHYSAGKAAFSALLGGLWMELKPFGICVVDLRPGDIRTGFNDHLPRTMASTSAYLPWTQRAWQETWRLFENAPPPDQIARAILKIARAKKTPMVVREGSFFQAVMGPLGVRFLSRQSLLDSIRGYYGLKEIDGQ